jgi:catalase
MLKAQISSELPSGDVDPGIVYGTTATEFELFVQSISRHRHPERETDPPWI